MLRRAEGYFDNGATLGGQAQAFAREKIEEPLFGTLRACIRHVGSIGRGVGASQRSPGARHSCGFNDRQVDESEIERRLDSLDAKRS